MFRVFVRNDNEETLAVADAESIDDATREAADLWREWSMVDPNIRIIIEEC